MQAHLQMRTAPALRPPAGNFVRATFFALANTYGFLSPDLWPQHPLPVSPMQASAARLAWGPAPMGRLASQAAACRAGWLALGLLPACRQPACQHGPALHLMPACLHGEGRC